MERRSKGNPADPAFRSSLRTSRSVIQDLVPTDRAATRIQPPGKVQHPAVQSDTTPLATRETAAVPLLKNRTEAFRPTQPKRHLQLHLPRQSRSNVLKRQTVKKMAKPYRPRHRRPFIQTFAGGAVILLITVGLLATYTVLKKDRMVKAQAKQQAKQTNADALSDSVPVENDQPLDISDYKVAPDLPRFLTIEKLSIYARIRSVGVGPNNMLKAPTSIFDVGWYEGSAKPGQGGVVVLDGHVSGATKRGVFYNISILKAGDKVKLERGDGKVFSYTVTGSQIYGNDKVDTTKLLLPATPGKAGLNLVTYSGRFDVRTNQYEHRVAVFTTQD